MVCTSYKVQIQTRSGITILTNPISDYELATILAKELSESGNITTKIILEKTHSTIQAIFENGDYL